MQSNLRLFILCVLALVPFGCKATSKHGLDDGCRPVKIKAPPPEDIKLEVKKATFMGFEITPKLVLYDDFNRLELGRPIPEEIKLDKNQAKSHREKVAKFGDATEHIKCQVNSDGNVLAKVHSMGAERFFFPIMWAVAVDRTEWVIFVSLDGAESPNDEVMSQKLLESCRRLWGGHESTLERALKSAVKREMFTRQLPSFSTAEVENKYIAVRRTTTTVERQSESVYRIVSEGRLSVSVAAWTLAGWVGMATGKFP